MTFARIKRNPDQRGPGALTWWDGCPGLCGDRAGRHRGVGVRRQTLSQFLQLHADGNQIWGTQLAINVLKLLNLQKKEKGLVQL